MTEIILVFCNGAAATFVWEGSEGWVDQVVRIADWLTFARPEVAKDLRAVRLGEEIE